MNVSQEEVIKRFRGSVDGWNILVRNATTKISLQGLTISGPQAGRDFTGVDFFRARIEAADFSNCILHYSSFGGATLVGSNFSSADLFESRFRATTIENCSFAYAKLISAKMISAKSSSTDFSGANFRASDLSGASFSNCNLNGANLRGANLTKVRGLTTESINFCIGDGTTTLPTEISPPKKLGFLL